MFRGAEAPANTDRQLVIAKMRHLHPVRTVKQQPPKKLDVSTLARDEEIASQYCIAVSNSFAALGSLPDGVEDSWSAIHITILQATQDTVPVISNVKRPWLSPDYRSTDKKRDARLRGSTDERRKYKVIFKARAKADLEEYYNRLADQAEEGIKHNNLRSAFRTIL